MWLDALPDATTYTTGFILLCSIYDSNTFALQSNAKNINLIKSS